jgi:long-chain acyl-CoA synthetase
VITVNTPNAFRIGTVGPPIAGSHVEIAADGEILTRGPGDEGLLQQSDRDGRSDRLQGWFHTGDIGEIRGGFLAITDRKKDIIVTAGGKNIAPQPIENLVKSNAFVTQAVMIGTSGSFRRFWWSPNFEQLENWAKKRNIIWTDRLS